LIIKNSSFRQPSLHFEFPGKIPVSPEFPHPTKAMNTVTGTESAELLALHGGKPEVSTPAPPLTHRWADEERELLNVMLEQNSLFYWNGPQTRLLIERFQKYYPLTYVMPCSSGTAGIHIAVEAAGIKPGDEVIVPPITDMGTVIGVLYQQAVPVFADLEPSTYNLDPADVRRRITPKTRAIIAVHLAGNPCRILELRKLADEHGLVLIEDCAQAWGAKFENQPVGTFGHIACYSLNDFKHIGCGDGGIVASSDERFGPMLQRCGDKAYDRLNGTKTPAFLAPNYRISEPQSAVAAAQMERMEVIALRRQALATRFSMQLADIAGILPHEVAPSAFCSYWFYLLRMEEGAFSVDRLQFVEALKAEGVTANAGYIPMPLYQFEVFRNHNFFGGQWPVRDMGLTTMDYRKVSCPNAEAIIKTCIQLKLHQGMDEAYIDGVARAFRKVAQHFRL